MKVFKIKLRCEGQWCICPEEYLLNLLDVLHDSQEDDEYIIQVTEMTQKEIDNLPELPGW